MAKSPSTRTTSSSPGWTGLEICRCCRGYSGSRNALPLHFDHKVHVDGNRLLVECSGAEAEVAHRRKYRRVELGVEGFDPLGILDGALRVDLQLQANFRAGRPPGIERVTGD